MVNNYVLNNTVCELNKSLKCKIRNIDDTCLVCYSNHYIDPTTQKCIPIVITKIILNCQKYDES